MIQALRPHTTVKITPSHSKSRCRTSGISSSASAKMLQQAHCENSNSTSHSPNQCQCAKDYEVSRPIGSAKTHQTAKANVILAGTA